MKKRKKKSLIINIIATPYRAFRLFCKGLFYSVKSLLETFIDWIYSFFKYLTKGILYISYLFYQLITFKIFKQKENIYATDKIKEDKLVLKDYSSDIDKLKVDKEISKHLSKAEIKKLKEETKKKVKSAKNKKRLEYLKIKQKKKNELEKKLAAKKDRQAMKAQQRNVLRKTLADKKIEKQRIIDQEKLAKEKLRHDKELAKIEEKKRKRIDKEEKRRAKMIAKIEKEKDKLLQSTRSKKEKVLGEIQAKIDKENIIISELTTKYNGAVVEKEKIKYHNDLVIHKDRLDKYEGMYRVKEAEFNEQEKRELEKYETKLNQAEILHNKLLYKATRKLRAQNEKEKEFIETQNTKNARKLKIDQALQSVREQEEKENNKDSLSFIRRIKKFFGDMKKNSLFEKNRKNKEAINREALLISFNDKETKSNTKIVFEYQGRDPDGKLVKGYFEAYSKLEVHSYLLAEGYDIYSIRTSKLIQLLHGGEGSTKKIKVKMKDLIFMLTQLSTYIKAGIPLVEAIRILGKQYKSKKYQRLFTALMYDLTTGDNFSDALEKQGDAFPNLLINMVRASEMTGELPESLDEMADYYTRADAVRKQMITALMYPSIVFVIAIAVMTFIMIYVIPKFVELYTSMDGLQIPAFTLAIVNISDYLQKNILYIFGIIIAVLLLFMYLYKNIKPFRATVQWVVMHMPVFGNVMIFNEVTMFTKTFSSLLKHNVFITDSMQILSKITNNEIYKMLILDTITNLARGEKISESFKDQWAFPVAAYEMIVTGEKTGQLAEMMDKVSKYYQELHANAVTRIKTFIEPIMILLLTGCTGVIVIAVIIPMFSLYDQLGNYT